MKGMSQFPVPSEQLFQCCWNTALNFFRRENILLSYYCPGLLMAEIFQCDHSRYENKTFCLWDTFFCYLELSMNSDTNWVPSCASLDSDFCFKKMKFLFSPYSFRFQKFLCLFLPPQDEERFLLISKGICVWPEPFATLSRICLQGLYVYPQKRR